jgi:hypothetical protein
MKLGRAQDDDRARFDAHNFLRVAGQRNARPDTIGYEQRAETFPRHTYVFPLVGVGKNDLLARRAEADSAGLNRR